MANRGQDLVAYSVPHFASVGTVFVNLDTVVSVILIIWLIVRPMVFDFVRQDASRFPREGVFVLQVVQSYPVMPL